MVNVTIDVRPAKRWRQEPEINEEVMAVDGGLDNDGDVDTGRSSCGICGIQQVLIF